MTCCRRPPGLSSAYRWALMEEAQKTLITAVKKDDATQVMQLIKDNEALYSSGVDKNKTTLLAAALSARALNTTRVLLRDGEAHLDANQGSPLESRWAKAPLELAIDSSRLQLPQEALQQIQELLAAGADASAELHAGFTPLSQFCRTAEDNGAAVRALVEAGAPLESRVKNFNLNSSDYRGQRGNLYLNEATALHIAAARGHTQGALELLRAGADREVRDSLGRTPADVAELRSGADPLFVALLRSGETQEYLELKAGLERLLTASPN